jgi:hypothetical protein
VWAVPETGFPEQGSPREKLIFALSYATLAAAKSKSSPWRFRVGETHADLFADPIQRSTEADPDGREAIIACGAALLHFRLALIHFGCCGTLEYNADLDEPDRLARVYFGSRAARKASENELFDSIPLGHAPAASFHSRPVAPDLTAGLKAAAEIENAWLEIAAAESARQHVVQLVEESRRRLSAVRGGFGAHARWTMEPSGFGRVPAVAAPLAKAAIRWLGLARSGRAQQIPSNEHAPVLAILKTKTDDERAWLQAGQAIERVLLHARARGLSASFLNELVRCGETRRQLRTTIGRRGFPQIILRLGYARETGTLPAAPNPAHWCHSPTNGL